MQQRSRGEVTNFEVEVLKRSSEIPVLADFWAAWCNPCRMLTPVLEHLAEQQEGVWVLAKINTEEHPEAAATYNVQSIPNVKLFSDGKVISEFVGVLPEYAIAQWLKQHLPGKYRSRVEEARRLITEGNVEDAGKVLEEILILEPDNQEVKTMLAKALLFKHEKRARELVGEVDDPRYSETADSVRTILHLWEVVATPALLPQSPTTASYLAAIEDVRSERFDIALARFIEIIRIDRSFDDDGSQKACIAIFKYLGEDHPITLNHRREFSSALYI